MARNSFLLISHTITVWQSRHFNSIQFCTRKNKTSIQFYFLLIETSIQLNIIYSEESLTIIIIIPINFHTMDLSSPHLLSRPTRCLFCFCSGPQEKTNYCCYYWSVCHLFSFFGSKPAKQNQSQAFPSSSSFYISLHSQRCLL